MAAECYADLRVDCSEFLRHKQTVIRPDLLAVRCSPRCARGLCVAR